DRRAAARRADAEREVARENDLHAAHVAGERETLRARAAGLESREAEVVSRERELDAGTRELDREVRALRERHGDLDAREAQLDRRQDELDQLAEARDAALRQVAGFTPEQARAEILTHAEAAARRDAATLTLAIETEARAEATATARRIVSDAVQRIASDQTSESVVSVMPLPSDEMKGRIIGREGRNIRSFESVTGVNVIIDDTPEAVLLSCFDPVRREIGRLTLERLVTDGRIHPHRIEEAYEHSKAEVDALCDRAARDALADVGLTGVDERLIPTIGRLKYRTSYGQNVLGHLVESAHLGAIMAAEIGVDPVPVKRAAFLHDIGKALTHEAEGSHAVVGAELLRTHGEAEEIAYAVEAHHNEVPPRSILDVLTQAADSCSAARPGARREALESYVTRLGRIEEIAAGKPGVEKVFAMQAGREVRVMVSPGDVDDLAASVLAREIAKEIEDELTYPGQIRVTVVRESRSTEIAH
ncbi:ribonuclease Y, partial [Jatrophihabitans sp. YIM 134969]